MKKYILILFLIIIALSSVVRVSAQAMLADDYGGYPSQPATPSLAPSVTPEPTIVLLSGFDYPKGYYGPKVFRREPGWSDGLDLSKDWILFTHMVACEAEQTGGYTEALAVANVILNRVVKGGWGNSIYSVVSAHTTLPSGKVVWQFTPYPIWETSTPQPSEIQACLDALNGWTNLSEQVQFFCTKKSYIESDFFRTDCVVMYEFGNHYYMRRK